MSCGTYVAPPSFQITQGGSTGGADCTAHAAAVLVRAATCGRKHPQGRTIRLQSNEPVPKPSSPGLNLAQVAAVIRSKYGVDVSVYIGSRALTWAQYEAKRQAGMPAILQVGYGPIADSEYDGARSRFRGNHAVAETVHATYDPLADGRYPGIWRHDGRVYPRSLMEVAARRLDIGSRLAGADSVWCLFAGDVVPTYRVSIHPKAGEKRQVFQSWVLRDGVIVGKEARWTGGFSAYARIRAVPWPAMGTVRYLLQLTSGSRRGTWVSAGWGEEL